MLSGPRTPGFFNSFEYGVAPRRFALRHAANFGRTYKARTLWGETIFTSDPEYIRRVFAADSEVFAPFASLSLGWLFGPRSVLITSGAVHRRQRKLLSPHLSGPRLRAFGRTMQSLADKHVQRLRAGESLRALDLSAAFTLDVIVRIVFGVEEDEEQVEGGELRKHLTTLVQDVPAAAIFAHPLRTNWYAPWARYLRACQRFDVWLSRKIGQRRAAGAPGDDVLSLLLNARYDDGTAMEDGEIRDQLITLLMAGHETTSLAMTNCLRHLHRAPELLARARAEIDAAGAGPDDVQRLPFLAACIDETLRIDPIVTDVGRMPHADFVLDQDLVVRPRQTLMVLIEALHHDRLLYPEPERFLPERFLQRKFAPHEFAPFGGGVRRCLGAAFSDYESKILLATLLRTVELELTEKHAEPRVRRNITMGPKHGVPMQVARLR